MKSLGLGSKWEVFPEDLHWDPLSKLQWLCPGDIGVLAGLSIAVKGLGLCPDSVPVTQTSPV